MEIRAVVTRSWSSRIARGMWVTSRSTLALVGLLVLGLTVGGVYRPDWREAAEDFAFGWLQVRQEAKQGDDDTTAAADADNSESTPQAGAPALAANAQSAQRVTAAEASSLTREQQAVAQWIARRYKVADAPIGRLVQEAWTLGQRAKLEPTLILAIMAVESSFNPYAQSNVGAQGLMQVMTNVHDKKFEPFGGSLAALDPLSNTHVGVQVLKECIARAGNLYDGLRHYVGAANLSTDNGYASKVLGEHQHLQRVAQGKAVPHNAPIVPVPAPTAANSATSAPSSTTPSSGDPAPATPNSGHEQQFQVRSSGKFAADS
jgi:hypothetical protein